LIGSYIESFRGSTLRGNHHFFPYCLLIPRLSRRRIEQFHESHNVLFFFSPESEEQSSVLLVYDPTSPSASPSPVEKAKNVEEVEKELVQWAKDAADVKSQIVFIDKKWRSAVVGKNGATLNA
jgi:hypothetical protein